MGAPTCLMVQKALYFPPHHLSSLASCRKKKRRPTVLFKKRELIRKHCKQWQTFVGNTPSAVAAERAWQSQQSSPAVLRCLETRWWAVATGSAVTILWRLHHALHNTQHNRAGHWAPVHAIWVRGCFVLNQPGKQRGGRVLWTHLCLAKSHALHRVGQQAVIIASSAKSWRQKCNAVA